MGRILEAARTGPGPTPILTDDRHLPSEQPITHPRRASSPRRRGGVAMHSSITNHILASPGTLFSSVEVVITNLFSITSPAPPAVRPQAASPSLGFICYRI